MDQLAIVAPKVVPKVKKTEAGVRVEHEGGELMRCLPPTPSMTMNAITFGIHAIDSYLHVNNECAFRVKYCTNSQMNCSTPTECDLTQSLTLDNKNMQH